MAGASGNLVEDVINLIDTAMTTYILDTFNNIAAALLPSFRNILVLYFMLYGLAIWRGLVELPAKELANRALICSLIYGLVFTFSIYNTFLVDVLTNSPDALAGAVSGTTGNAISTDLGLIYQNALDATARAFDVDGWFLPYVLGILIFLAATVAVTLTLFNIGIAKIAIAILVATGPIFIVLRLFDFSKKMFDAWLQQVINYILLIVFTVAVLTFFNGIFQAAIDAIPADPDSITLGNVTPTVVVGVLVFLVLRQVSGLASSIAGGVQLSGFSVSSYTLRNIGGAFRSAPGAAYRGGQQTVRVTQKIYGKFRRNRVTGR